MTACSRVLSWEIPWTEEPGGLHTVHGVIKERDMTEPLSTHAQKDTKCLCHYGEESRPRHTYGRETLQI